MSMKKRWLLSSVLAGLTICLVLTPTSLRANPGSDWPANVTVNVSPGSTWWSDTSAQAFHAANDWSGGIELMPYTYRIWVNPPVVGNLRLPKLDKSYNLNVQYSTSSQALRIYGPVNNVGLRLNGHTYSTDCLTITGSVVDISSGTLEAKTIHIDEAWVDITSPDARIKVSELLYLGPNGILTAVPGVKIEMNGASWQNAATSDAASYGLQNLELLFQGTGGTPATLEVASAEEGGFSGNYALWRLRVGGTTPGEVLLFDHYDNRGSRSKGKECLFVEQLSIGPSSTLDLNGLAVFAQGDVEGAFRSDIAAGRIVDMTLTGKNRLDAVYNTDRDWTPVGQRVPHGNAHRW